MKFKATTTPWLTLAKPNPVAVMRLFCLPYAGGSPLIFRDWPSALPASVEICPIQLPGRGMRLREPPFNRLEPLLDSLIPALRPFLNKPFALFGHSMGGLICFELTRALRINFGLEPRCLFIAGRQAPPIQDRTAVTFNLPEPEFIAQLRHLNGTPQEVLDQPELMQLLVPLLRAEFELCQTYVHEPGLPLDCPISVFGGLNDSEVAYEELESWRDYTTAALSLHMLPGDHFFLQTSQSQLLQMISEDLKQEVEKLNQSSYASQGTAQTHLHPMLET